MTEDKMMKAHDYTLSVATKNGHPDPRRVAVVTVADLARQEAVQEAVAVIEDAMDLADARQAVLNHFGLGEGEANG